MKVKSLRSIDSYCDYVYIYIYYILIYIYNTTFLGMTQNSGRETLVERGFSKGSSQFISISVWCRFAEKDPAIWKTKNCLVVSTPTRFEKYGERQIGSSPYLVRVKISKKEWLETTTYSRRVFRGSWVGQKKTPVLGKCVTYC